MITVNNLIDGISQALYAEFGEDYEICTEEIKQGLHAPIFSIVPLSASIEQVLGERYRRGCLFNIYYFPKSEDEAIQESLEIEERLMRCLEYLTVDEDLIRGTALQGAWTDGVLAFQVKYNAFVLKNDQKATGMSALEHRMIT